MKKLQSSQQNKPKYTTPLLRSNQYTHTYTQKSNTSFNPFQLIPNKKHPHNKNFKTSPKIQSLPTTKNTRKQENSRTQL